MATPTLTSSARTTQAPPSQKAVSYDSLSRLKADELRLVCKSFGIEFRNRHRAEKAIRDHLKACYIALNSGDIGVDDLLALSTLETPALSQVIQYLSTVLEQRQAQNAAVQLRETLEQKTVPELKALAQELGLSLRSRLKKAEIIAAIVTAQTQTNATPGLTTNPATDSPQAQTQADAQNNEPSNSTPVRDNRAIWEQWCREVDALEFTPPDLDKNANDPFLEKFRRQGLTV
ncbi:MAG: Rho termination factor N-terminal domain-containing protein [Prochlorothrix sp.]|nr:Rho termination factor N-terminal domain-containing protein [Prochlorothrix sp.]